LEEARRIQRGLLPAALPEIAGWAFAAGCDEAASVGGDTYDVVQLDASRVAVSIADVAGKGIPAALLASNLQAAVRSVVGAHVDPAEACTKVNERLCPTMPDDRFATFVLLVLDTAAGTVTYCNAGHNPPLLVGADGQASLLSGGGTVLGFSTESRYQSRQVAMPPGSVLVLYTDGITEACDDRDEEFGEMRLGARVAVDRGRGAAAIRDSLFDAVRAFSKTRADDQTVVVVTAAG
jgi:sigma-B regulation protein RsbU (phosphoserine phosphatase)